MSKLSLKEIGKLDVKDIGKLFKNVKTKEINYKLDESSKKLKNKKSKQVLAIDIGSHSIKIVEGKFEKNTINIDRLIKTGTPQGAISDGRIMNEDIVIDSLKKIIAQNQIKTKNIIFTTNSSQIINREILIPLVSKEEIETVIKFEIQQYLPINLEHYIIQYLIIEEVLVEGNKKLKVNVTSFPERMAYSYYKVINKLELTPLGLDVNYNSIKKLANISEFNSSNKNGSVAFIDIGATSINISILKNGKLAFTRMIKIGGEIIDNDIQEELNISIKATESIKIREVDILDGEERLNLVARGAVDEIIEEIERILKFYDDKFTGGIEKVYLYGGTSKLNNLITYFNEKLELKIEFLDSIKNLSLSEKSKEENLSEYLNAIGAIIRL
ncbi:type IV pilus assembly protein PilM [Clostridium sp.]|uniref:type IV pilus assembly protein PilM n=1 Tax=Clostridium sp. TaxID=1506 RepID=UPI0029091FA7|nr:type IV pilus assembly protein PilM [Clostridium sp.]MDU5107369.1 type IV pilus assembly protein PilM [Clostridium sp.]